VTNARRAAKPIRVGGAFAEPTGHLVASLAAARPGRTYLLFTHPAFGDAEMQGMTF